jgi:formylglycine-generating enzyme required for sulfatase activity
LAAAKAECQAELARYIDSGELENPAHEVTLTKPFYLGRYEVTQEQFEQVLGARRGRFKGRDLPVERVSWDEAQEFCRKVSDKTAQSVQLPTEAEWEYACRAGTRTTYSTGDSVSDLDRAAWYRANSGGRTHPVGQKAPNVWGLYDMHGNVYECCADWRGDYSAEAVTNPQGSSQGAGRVLRGGSWGDSPWGCRAAFRNKTNPDDRSSDLGFRVAASVSKTP